MENRPPIRNLPKKAFPASGTVRPKQTLYHFGVPISRRFGFAYAQHFHLTIELEEEDRDEYGGKTVLNFADIDETTIQDPHELGSIRGLAELLMLDHLGEKLGFRGLTIERPFSSRWEYMVALWSNRSFNDLKQRRPWMDAKKLAKDLLDVLSVVDEAHDDQVRWWFDWNNGIVRSSILSSRVDVSDFIPMPDTRYACLTALSSFLLWPDEAKRGLYSMLVFRFPKTSLTNCCT